MNSTHEFLKFLHSLHHPTYEKDGVLYQWPLKKMTDFCHYMGDPQQKLKMIHVAGTNGKGSCVAILSSYLRILGFSVGIYISPEVLDFRERIQVNGRPISTSYIEEFYKNLLDYSLAHHNKRLQDLFDTYSQVLVAMAFSYFNNQRVDYAIIETGIGGENDPTNIITPVLSIITSIGFDHTKLLGNELRTIAKAKCGIIKDGIPVIVGQIDSTIKEVFISVAEQKHSQVFFTDEYIKIDFMFEGESKKVSPYLKRNAECCWVGVSVLSYQERIGRPNWTYFEKAVHVHKMENNLHGRWEKVSSRPDIYLDICDNELGAKCVFKYVEEMMRQGMYERLVIIIGLTGPSKLNVIQYLPQDAKYYYTQSHGYISAEEVRSVAGFIGDCFSSPVDAIQCYLSCKEKDDLVLVAGSIHIITDALRFFTAYNASRLSSHAE